MTLTEREILIAKIAITQGIVTCTRVTPEEATVKLKEFCVQHNVTFQYGLDLEKEIDQMFGDDSKR